MANRERGEFTILSGGDAYTLRLTTNACGEMEDLFKQSLQQVIDGVNAGAVRPLQYLLWACLRDKHPGLATTDPTTLDKSLARVGDFVDGAGGLQGVLAQVREFMGINADGSVASPRTAQVNGPRGTGGASTPTPSPSA